MNTDRIVKIKDWLNLLPEDIVNYSIDSRLEQLAVDEAAIWKRIINYRLVTSYHFQSILETHGGEGLSTYIYKQYSKANRIVSCSDYEKDIANLDFGIFDLIDIDPFGQPWDAIELIKKLYDINNSIVMVTNGEAMLVSRKLLNSLRYRTEYWGKDVTKWCIEEYIPLVENILGMKCQFYYIYPSSARLILANKEIEKFIFEGCPQYMWWVQNPNRVKEMELI